MIDLPFIPIDMVKSAVENFAVIVALLLLYYFIPDTVRSRSKLLFSLCVGLIFGFIAFITIPALWQALGAAPAAPLLGFDPLSLAGPTAGAPLQDLGNRILGINVILVPLSGFIAGPVSAVIVAGALLLGSLAAGGPPQPMDIITLVLGILLGALFYWCRTWDRFPRSYLVQVILLGAGFALMDSVLLVIRSQDQASTGPGTLPLTLSSFVICCVGIIILGLIVGFIDRKKQAEKEIRDYRDRLEGLVKERTTELRQANSLLKAAFEATADGIVVTDTEDVIRGYNRKAARILNLPESPPQDAGESRRYTDQIVASLSEPEKVIRHFAELAASSGQVVTTDVKFTGGGQFELYVHPQEIGNQIIGRVWSLHDITEQRMAEEALRSANNKLILLSSITRHDILNQLTALHACIDLMKENPEDRAVPGYLDLMEKTIEVIRLQVEFTSDYQDLGQKEPVWQDICQVFLAAAEPFANRNITSSCDTGALECYADALIGRVFYNMIDNSIRHGGYVSAIRLFLEKADPDLILVYEDNGIGVAPEEKDKIFLKGFGKHTGLGMFLIREILSITGMTIRETGIPGTGVRFEIRIPAGAFKFRPTTGK